MASSQLSGIFVPNMIAYDEQGDINEAETRRYIEWLIQNGVDGLYPNGSMGEFTRFTSEERQFIIRMIADQADGRVSILAGAAEANVRETLKVCERYGELGVRAVSIVSPFYYKLGPESVYAYFAEIAKHSPVDVVLYNIPLFASPIDVATVARLSEFERVIGIKDSSGDLAHMTRMIAAVRPSRPDFSFLTGWDPCLMAMLLSGANGGVNAIAGVAPPKMTKLLELTKAGRLDEASVIQSEVTKLFDLMLGAMEFPEGFRTALELLGFKMGRGRMPKTNKQLEMISELRDKVGAQMKSAGLLNAE
ncbi:dihydrodipicolinate synthase family protein [Calycomorphotria hydatis]|uniref:Putative 2-keto-3-deoxy-galactonate aldolase YagE n=1 Tax=Calycomorphotria hydatis TaxID=2528027 RepID=A0A517T9W3_9PLAN|nr:dihydrodipicolinate synthase family protein [Calycomorphotria hydatis]QDT65153.1 putative 2-keto-3-deoxy-galactonate aldolase YagE [Calycomorphotria hydatis]